MAEPCACSWLDKAKAIATVLVASSAPLAAFIGALNHQQAVSNSEQITAVQDKQKHTASQIDATLKAVKEANP